MPQNPVFEIEFEETVAGFQIRPVGADPFPTCEVNEDAPADAPRVIVRDNQDWNVSFRWRTQGPTTEIITEDTKWKLSVHLLRLNAPGNPILAGSKDVNHVAVDPHDYVELIPVAAAAIPDGLYKLYVNVDVDVPTAAKARITGFAEGPMMEFYTPN